jgi:hypothetical protein
MEIEKLSEENLEDLDDKALRDLIDELKAEGKALKRLIEKVRQKYWSLVSKKEELECFIRKVRIIRGRKKGKECPAKVRRPGETIWKSYRCDLKADSHPFRDSVEFYKDVCEKCRYTPEYIVTKLAWKRVLENRKRLHQ